MPRALGHAALRREDGRQVQFVDDIRHNIGQMALGQPVSRRRRHQPQVVGLIGAKGSGGHRRAFYSLTNVFCLYTSQRLLTRGGSGVNVGQAPRIGSMRAGEYVAGFTHFPSSRL